MIKFNISQIANKDLVNLLIKNVIGTPGLSMRYRHLEVLKKIASIKKSYYVSLIHNDTIIGTCCFCNRLSLNSGKLINSFYLRYFTFSEKYRTTKDSKRKRQSKNSVVRNEIELILQGKGINENSTDAAFYHYAYVDPRNIRSVKLCNEFGFEPVRKFSTIIFNRINPKDSSLAEESKDEDQFEIVNLLSAFYKNYNMFSTENISNLGSYYVIKDKEGIILVGMQANPDRWKIIELPGLSGKIILNTFSSLPILKKLINKNYRFLTIEGIYYKQGHQKQLEVLIEALLAKYNLNSAMMWADTNSELYNTLHSIDLGTVAKINKEVQTNVICRFFGFDTHIKDAFRLNPAYISGIDLT